MVSISHNKDLKQVVEEQAREIQRLKAQLSGMQVSRIDETVVQAGNMITGITGDRAVGLAFPALLRGLTTKEDVRRIRQLCFTVSGEAGWEDLFQAFYDSVVETREQLPDWVREREIELEDAWFREPWYLMYAQWMGVTECEGNFDTARKALPYIRGLGFRNICLLPHYESPMADGGYDVSDYVTRASLGGEEAFERFLKDAHSLGIRVVTDAVFNHTSTEHHWFQQALEGSEHYLAYYVQRNGREKIDEFDRSGDIVCRYRDPDGTITERVVVFPDIDRTHGLWAEINGKTYQFYRSFLPFQVDLNLRNPSVMRELFKILGREVRMGVLGKRVDAAAHWVKVPGRGEGLEECHAVQAIIKSFLRHICGKAIVLPEIVRDAENASCYVGELVRVNGRECPSEGDGIVGFEMQACLRESAYFQTVGPFWRGVFRSDVMERCVWINILEHHDESFLGFYAGEVRRWIGEYVKSHGGVVMKNGMSGCGRVASCLDGDGERIATSVFLLYLARGVPMVYAGLESGAHNAWEHCRRHEKERKKVFDRLGVFCKDGFDGRELHRGGVAVGEGGVIRRVVSRLNEIWGRLGGGGMTSPRPIDSGDVGVIVCERNGWICIANLTGLRKTVRMPVAQLNGDWSGVVRDILDERRRVVTIRIEGAMATVEMARYERAILENTGVK